MIDFCWQRVTDLVKNASAVRKARYGVIEIVDGDFRALRLRPWPKLATLLDVMWLGPRLHTKRSGDRTWLYYNQPLRQPNFLAVTYMVSTGSASLASFQRALAILDEVARIKRTDAIVCEAWNQRFSPRLMQRFGWEAHLPNRWRRHYIKRFYGVYPGESPALKIAAVASNS